MKDIRDITNREEIVESLADLLQQFDKDENSYQTDVYMYIDEETGAATLKTFVNVGGNSWLNDDHTTIYTDKEHFETLYDYYNNGDFAEALEMEYEELQKEVTQNLIDSGEAEEGYKPDWYDIRDYIRTRADYSEKLEAVYSEYIDENRADYIDHAEEIIEEAELAAEEEEEYRKYYIV